MQVEAVQEGLALTKGKGAAGDAGRKAAGGGVGGEGKVKLTAEERDRQNLKRSKVRI